MREGRNVAANLSIKLDRDRAYLNTRLPHLEGCGLVEKIGPAERSGLYEFTDRGRVVLEHREEYGELDADRFEKLLDHRR